MNKELYSIGILRLTFTADRSKRYLIDTVDR